jgi:hypothetical protein
MQNFGDALWSLYIEFSTANFPDVMLPAYNINGFYVIIFYSYETLNLYLFGNMILGTINNAFQDNLKVIMKYI